MKKILFSLFLFFFFLVFPQKSFADNKFSTSYDTTYYVLDSGVTQVIQKFSLTNKTSKYYTPGYSIQTSYSNLAKITVMDEDGKIKYDLTQNNHGALIKFNFNKNVVGIDRVKKFSVSFETTELTKKSGKIWEVNIPGVSGQENYDSFTTQVNVPSDFGPASIIKPDRGGITRSDSNLLFTKDELGDSGISITYGKDQAYNFDLKYHLINKNLVPATQEIALPSNNNYQNIIISDISPRPENVYIDSDGNYIAKFRLSPSQKKDIEVTGQAEIFAFPKQENLTSDKRNLYLGSQQYWETQDPQIKNLAKELKTPEAIFDYVSKNLKYDSRRVKENQVRAGAKGVLQDKNSAVCLEFTDLFVALSRAAGIPARMAQGYANTENSSNRPLSLSQDVLHAWPEYYDEQNKEWIMVDPTWQNTTGGTDYFRVLDFDHFAFVINGVSSTYPIPAGGYKLPEDMNSQDVLVTPADSFQSISPAITAKSNFSKNYMAGLPVTGGIIITNLSGVATPSKTFQIAAKNLDPNNQNLYFAEIPPYGSVTVPIKFASKPFLTNEKDTVKITIGKDTLVREVNITPIYEHIVFYLILGGIIVGIFTLKLFVSARRSRRLQVS